MSIRYKFARTLAISAGTLFAINLTVSGQPAPPPYELDGVPGNNADEIELFAIYNLNPEVADADTIERDGLLSDAEIAKAVAAYQKKLRAIAMKLPSQKEEISAMIETRMLKRGVVDSVPNEDVVKYVDIPMRAIADPTTPLSPPFGGLQIRRSAQDIDATYVNRYLKNRLAGNAAGPALISSINPAELGFIHNDVNGEETWFARGVIASPIILSERGQGSWGWEFNPYVSFDRVANRVNRNSDIDRLTGTVAMDAVTPGFGPVGMSVVEAAFDYTTNFDFDGQMYSGHVTWTPLMSDWSWLANEQFLPLFGGFDYRTRQFLHVEGGNAQRIKSPLIPGDFLRAGGGFGIDVSLPIPSKEVTAFADYRHFWDVLGNDDDHYNFRVGLGMPLDATGHIVLQAAFEKGRIQLTQQNVDLLTVTFGIRF